MKKMKKALAALLAGTMVMSMSMTAWATEVEKDSEFAGWEDDLDSGFTMPEVKFTKDYELTNVGTISPEETFEFTIENFSVTDAASGVTTDTMPTPKIGNTTYNSGEAGSATKSHDIGIEIPDNYTSVGIYKYTIKEKKGDTAGVTYYDKEIRLVVTVQQGADGKFHAASIHTEEGFDGTEEDGKKVDNFPNEYSAGRLFVEKIVTGNMGDQSKEFPVNVAFYAPTDVTVRENITYIEDGQEKTIEPKDWKRIEGTDESVNYVTVTINLKHEETVLFTNIPYGVKYNVMETQAEGYDAPTYKVADDENTAETDKGTSHVKDEVLDHNYEAVVITNNKGVAVDTGINLDSMPYVLLLAVAAVGVFAFVAKKRDEEMF